MSASISRLAVRRAWALAGAHGHHWATGGTSPWNLALGRALRDECAFPANWWAHSSTIESIIERIGVPRPPEIEGWTYIEMTGRPPRTVEECEALSALPSGPCGGITFAVDGDGHIRHQTGTGRTRWDVAPDGSVTIEIHRPTGIVLSAYIPAAARSGSPRVVVANHYRGERERCRPASRQDGFAIVEHGDYSGRHVEALSRCLVALGLSGHIEGLSTIGGTYASARYAFERMRVDPSRKEWVVLLKLSDGSYSVALESELRTSTDARLAGPIDSAEPLPTSED